MSEAIKRILDAVTDKVKQLWQDERDERWQQYYDDYCRNNCIKGQPSGQEHDAACDYANDMMEEDDAKENRGAW